MANGDVSLIRRAEETSPPSTARILLISNDEQLRALLSGLLVAHGYSGVAAVDTRARAPNWTLPMWDIAVIDTSVSYDDTMRVLKELKRAGVATIAIFSTRAVPRELVAGADVLLGKPFDPRELLLVIRGMLQGSGGARSTGDPQVSAGPITLSTLLNQATVASSEIALTGVEARLLYELVINAGHPVTRVRLMRRALPRVGSPDSRGLDTHIKRLRRKIGVDQRGRTPIRTVRGVGYLLIEHWEPRS